VLSCFFLNVRVLKLTIVPLVGESGLTGVSWIKSLNDLLPSPVGVRRIMVGSIVQRIHIMDTMTMIMIIILIQKQEGEKDEEGHSDFLVNCSTKDL
jgi:hypothetical protein